MNISRLWLNFVKIFLDFSHWQQPLSESAINQSVDLIFYREITKMANNSVQIENWCSFFPELERYLLHKFNKGDI